MDGISVIERRQFYKVEVVSQWISYSKDIDRSGK
jgi:hypothetical protein